MAASWVVDEMKAVDLHDKHLDAHLREVLSQLSSHPTASIPAACGGRAEMEAAYRLFDNDQVSFDAILQSHSEATRRRIGEQSVVILAQDTTNWIGRDRNNGLLAQVRFIVRHGVALCCMRCTRSRWTARRWERFTQRRGLVTTRRPVDRR